MGICLNWGFHYSLSWPYLSGEVLQYLSPGRKEVISSVHLSRHKQQSGTGRRVPRSRHMLQAHQPLPAEPSPCRGAPVLGGCKLSCLARGLTVKCSLFDQSPKGQFCLLPGN